MTMLSLCYRPVDAARALGIQSVDFQESLAVLLREDWDMTWNEQAVGLLTRGFVHRGDLLAWRCLLYRLKELIPNFSASTVVGCVRHLAELRIFEGDFEHLCRQRLLQRACDLTSAEVWTLFCETDLLAPPREQLPSGGAPWGQGHSSRSGDNETCSTTPARTAQALSAVLLRRIPDLRFANDPLVLLWKVAASVTVYELEEGLCRTACAALLQALVRRKQHRTKDARFVMARLPGAWRGAWQLAEAQEKFCSLGVERSCSSLRIGGGVGGETANRSGGHAQQCALPRRPEVVDKQSTKGVPTKTGVEVALALQEIPFLTLRASKSPRGVEELPLTLRALEEQALNRTCPDTDSVLRFFEELRRAERRYGVGARGGLVGAGAMGSLDVLRLGRVLFVQDLARAFAGELVGVRQLLCLMRDELLHSPLLETYLLTKGLRRFEDMENTETGGPRDVDRSALSALELLPKVTMPWTLPVLFAGRVERDIVPGLPLRLLRKLGNRALGSYVRTVVGGIGRAGSRSRQTQQQEHTAIGVCKRRRAHLRGHGQKNTQGGGDMARSVSSGI